MPGGLTLLQSLPADIPTPAAGKVTIFFNLTSGLPSYKNDVGTVLPLGATGAQGPIGPPMVVLDEYIETNLLAGPSGSGSGGSGGWVLLESQTASASASLVFDNIFTSLYDDYIVEILGLIPSADNNINLEISIDNGATYLNTNYIYAMTGISDANLNFNFSSKVGTVYLIGGPVESTREGAFGILRMWAPLTTGVGKQFHFDGGWAHSDTNRYAWSGSWWHATTSAITAIRITPAAGTITSGIIRVYGISKV